MKYIGLLLAALLAGCGNAGDATSTRVAAGFVATPAATSAARRAPAPPATPSADAFHAQVSAVLDTPGADAAEPAAVGRAPANAPEDSEPAPL